MIDSFLLSCRVIGRKVETALLGTLCRVVRLRGGISLLGEYIPTVKNQPAADLYPRHGFKRVREEDRFWLWDLAAGDVAYPEFVKVSVEDASER